MSGLSRVLSLDGPDGYRQQPSRLPLIRVHHKQQERARSPFQRFHQLARHLILERNSSSFGIRKMLSPFQPSRQWARHLILERNSSSFGIRKMLSPFQPSRQLARHLVLERNFSSFRIHKMRSPFHLCPSRFWSGFSLFYLQSPLQRKSHLCIPRKGIARPQYQFPHSCVCERFIYS